MDAVTVHSDFEAQENKVCHCFIFFSPSMCHEVMGPDAMISVFQKLLSFELADSGYKMVNKTNVVPDLMELKV